MFELAIKKAKVVVDVTPEIDQKQQEIAAHKLTEPHQNQPITEAYTKIYQCWHDRLTILNMENDRAVKYKEEFENDVIRCLKHEFLDKPISFVHNDVDYEMIVHSPPKDEPDLPPHLQKPQLVIANTMTSEIVN